MVKLYGAPYTRASRNVWMLEELGIDYETVNLHPRAGDTRTDDFLKVNPNGHVPALQDGDLTICESVAINLYLADKYQKLMPTTAEGRALAYQWSIWAMTEAEPPMILVLKHRMLLPEAERDESIAAAAYESIQTPLKVLEKALSGKDYLGGSNFTVTDLNTCSVLGFLTFLQYDLSAYPKIGAWMQRCGGRPAAQKAAKIAKDAMAAAMG